MFRNKRLQKFDTLGLIDKIKVIKEYLISPWFAVQLRGMQRIDDFLNKTTKPSEQEYILGLVTSAFAHEKQIRQWAGRIIGNYFPEHWDYIGADLERFYAKPQSKSLITIVRKALDILDKPDPSRKVVSTRDTPNFFQPNHRHGLDLLWLGAEAGIFNLPNDVGDSGRSLFSDFILKEFNQEFPSIEVGELLHRLLKTDKDPFVLRRIMDFFGKTALPINNHTSAFDAVLLAIQPPEEPVDYFEYSTSYYQVIEYGIQGALTLFALPWYEEVRLLLGQQLPSIGNWNDLVDFTNEMHQGFWPAESTWLVNLQQWKERNQELGDNLEKAYQITQNNRGRLSEVLVKIIANQRIFTNKPDLHKDINCRDAIEALAKLGEINRLISVWAILNTGLNCKAVSFTLQGWSYAVVGNLERFEPSQRYALINELLILGRSGKSQEEYVKKIMGKIQTHTSGWEFNRAVRENTKHLRNHLVKLYVWGNDNIDRNILFRESLGYYQSIGLLKDFTGNVQITDFVNLWNDLLAANNKLLATKKINDDLVGQLKFLIRKELQEAPDRKTLINRSEYFSSLINRLKMTEQIRPFFPSDVELIGLKGIGNQLRLIQDVRILQNEFEKSVDVTRKLALWLELLIRNPRMPYLDCPISSNLEENADKKNRDLINSIPDHVWLECVPKIMELPLREVSGVLDLVRGLLRETRYKPYYGFQGGGLNKYVRQHLSGEAAYLVSDEWIGETEVTDPDLAKLAWINLLRAAEYANINKLPFPPGPNGNELLIELDQVDSSFINKLANLEKEDTLVGTVENGKIYLHEPSGRHIRQNVVFASPVLDSENIWCVVTQKLDIPNPIKEYVKNIHDNQLLNFGDCVIGKIVRLTANDNLDESYIVDLGNSYPTGIWNEVSPKELLSKKIEKLDQSQLFVVIGRDDSGNLLLSRKAFLAMFKEHLVTGNSQIDIEVYIDEILPNGNVRVLCEHLSFEIIKEEVTWAESDKDVEVLSYLKIMNIPVQICLFRSQEKGEVLPSFKRRKPILAIEDLAMRFGIRPFQLVFVEAEKNDLIFEVRAILPDMTFPNHLIVPGTLCRLNAEHLVDKDELNYHPLLVTFSPKPGEIFEAKWLMPDRSGNSSRPWQQEGQAVLQIRRSAPFRYDLHREFGINSLVTIAIKEGESWSEKPKSVFITEPCFEDFSVPAMLFWEEVNPLAFEKISTLEHSQKLRAKIVKYEEGRPVVLPSVEKFGDFEVNKSYSLRVVGRSAHGKRNHLKLSHWASTKKLVIYEDQLGYNPEITLNNFQDGTTLEAVYIGEKLGELCFSLLRGESAPTIRSAEHLKLPVEGAYVGYESKGYEKYVWIETEPGVCLRIDRQCLDQFSKKYFELGDSIVVRLGKSKNSLNLFLQDREIENPVRKLIEINSDLSGIVISETNKLVKVMPPGLRSVIGRLDTEDQHSFRNGDRLTVKIESMWMNFYSGSPRLNIDLLLVVSQLDRLSILDLQNDLRTKPKMRIWGRIESANSSGLQVKVSSYDSEIEFSVPYRYVSTLPSRRNFQYYKSVANPRLNRSFQLVSIDLEAKTATLSMVGSIAENLKRDGKINSELGIEKGEACLVGISNDGLIYYFETAYLIRCKVNFNDVEVSADQRREYFNQLYCGGLFNFEIHNNMLALNSQPILPSKEAAKSFKNQVFLGRLSQEGKNWRINFIGNAAKKYVQLHQIKAMLDPDLLENGVVNFFESQLVSIVFKRFDNEHEEIAYFNVWNREEVQKNEIEVQVYPPSLRSGDWIVHPQDMHRSPLQISHLTAASSLKMFMKIENSDKYFHVNTLNFNPESWYRAVFVKREKYSFISFKECDVQDMGSLDRYFSENPGDVRLVFTLLKDASMDSHFLHVERLPGLNYRIPYSCFNNAIRIKKLHAGDRVLVNVFKTDNISHRFEIEAIFCDQWFESLYPDAARKNQFQQAIFNQVNTAVTFGEWHPSRERFSVHFQDKDQQKKLWLEISAFPTEQRESFLWLRTGDRLLGYLTIAHEGVRYSEHGVFHINDVEIGANHWPSKAEPLKIGSISQCQVTEILEDGFTIKFANAPEIEGFLPDAEVRFLLNNGCSRTDLTGLEFAVQVIDMPEQFIKVSYDQYISRIVKGIPVNSILPGVVLQNCYQGSLMKFPGFVCYVSSRDLLHGYSGKGVLPIGENIYCQVGKWQQAQYSISISHTAIPDSLARNATAKGTLIFHDPDYLLIRFGQSYGVIDAERISSEFKKTLAIGQFVFLRDYYINNSRYLTIRQKPSLAYKQRIAWNRICQHFPNWFDEILNYHWDQRKVVGTQEHNWLSFGEQLSSADMPISYQSVSAVARFLAIPVHRLDVSETQPDEIQGDWQALFLASAKIIQAPQFYSDEKNLFVLLFVGEYFLSSGEQLDQSNGIVPWKTVYDILVRFNRQTPGVLGVLIGQIVAGRKAGLEIDFSPHIEEITQRLSSNFGIFLNPYWPDWKRDIELHAIDKKGQLPIHSQRIFPGNLPEGLDELAKQIREGKKKSGLKIGRLHYLRACIYFVQQEMDETFEQLREAEYHLNKETEEECWLWQQRIEQFRLLVYLVAGKLHPTSTNRTSESSSFDGLVASLSRYCAAFLPEREANPEAIVFATGLALALKDYGYLQDLTTMEKSPNSFLSHLLTQFLANRRSQFGQPVTSINRDLLLTTGLFVPKFQI